jgi:hypothetical protein
MQVASWFDRYDAIAQLLGDTRAALRAELDEQRLTRLLRSSFAGFDNMSDRQLRIELERRGIVAAEQPLAQLERN